MRRRIAIPLLLTFALLPAWLQCHAARPAPPPEPGAYEREATATSPDEVFAQMQRSFRADRARGQHLRFQFNFNDPQGGKWWIEVNDGAYTMGKGVVNRPNVTISCTGADWVRLSNGTLSGVGAFMTGRLRVSGNHFQAHKLDEIFP